jgi:hypothetical protein
MFATQKDEFVLPSVRVRMVELTTEQRVFVATTYTLTQVFLSRFPVCILLIAFMIVLTAED